MSSLCKQRARIHQFSSGATSGYQATIFAEQIPPTSLVSGQQTIAKPTVRCQPNKSLKQSVTSCHCRTSQYPPVGVFRASLIVSRHKGHHDIQIPVAIRLLNPCYGHVGGKGSPGIMKVRMTQNALVLLTIKKLKDARAGITKAW